MKAKGEEPKNVVVSVPKKPVEKVKVQVKDLNKKVDVQPITDPQPKSNFTVNTTKSKFSHPLDTSTLKKAPERKPYMNDAIRKKLGL